MFFFLSVLKGKKRHKKNKSNKHTEIIKKISEATKKHREDNSRKLHLSHRKKKKREAIRPDFGLQASDKRRKRDEAIRRLDGSLQQMKSLPSVDIRGTVRIRPHFDKPQKTGVCIRRDIRRKILFATGKAGKIKVKKAHWTSDSRVVCR